MNRIVVIGTSSGGLEALRTLTAGLRPDFPAPICIVIHTAPDAPDIAHEIIGKASPLKAVSARNLDRLEAGRIYVAPPDCHLLVEPNRVRLTRGPRENRFRPAIDPLFRTAAQAFGPAAIGVILTGNLDDGTAGLSAIKQLGGIAIVQDPRDALFPSMPQSALFHVKADYCVPLDRIAAVLGHVTRQSVVATASLISPELDTEVRIAKEENPMEAGLERLAKPSRFACPDCHGVLLQFTDQNRIRFRCHTGHAYSIDSLLGAYSEQIETSHWNAIRSLEETALFLDALTQHVQVAHTGSDASPYASRAVEARKDAARLREIVDNRAPLVGEGQRGQVPEPSNK